MEKWQKGSGNSWANNILTIGHFIIEAALNDVELTSNAVADSFFRNVIRK